MFDWVVSSDLPFNDPDTLIFLHHSTGSRSSPDISFAPSSLALSCSWEVLQDLGSDQLPILLSVPLSPVFYPNERPPSFNFQKARRDGFAFYFDFHHLLQRNTRLFLFISLALNAAKSSIPFHRICSFLSPFQMGLTNPGRALGRSSLLSISLKLSTLSGIPPFSTN